MPYVMALDQGTTSSRARVYDEQGQVVASAQREFVQHYPRPGWVEHDPEDIWFSQRRVAEQALAQAGIDGRDLLAIGITNQRETTVVWDRHTGEPVHPAIVWQCRRSAEICERLKREGFDEHIQRSTGLVTDAYFSASKLVWMFEGHPELLARAERGELAFGTVDSWLVWRLTHGREHATDVSNASRTMMFDIHRGEWDTAILDHLGIPASILPEVRASDAGFGETDYFGGSVPICGVLGDQQAATFGQLCDEPGMGKNTYGTGCFIVLNTGDTCVHSQHQLLSTVLWQRREAGAPTYALEGAVFMAGAVVQWLRDGLGLIQSAAEVEALADTVPDAGGAMLVPAFVGLGAPHWDPYARGTLVGMSRGTTKAHIARAALESIAHQTCDVVEAMQLDSGRPMASLRVDGGASANDLLMQMQADLLGMPIERPVDRETTARGAAYLAVSAKGLWGDESALRQLNPMERVFEPRWSADRRETERRRWRRAVARSSAWLGEA